MPDTFVPDILSVFRNSDREFRLFLCGFFHFHFQSVTLCIERYVQGVARFRFLVEDEFRQAVFQVVLDGTFQRAGTELYVVTLFGHEAFGFRVEQESVAATFDAVVESFQLNIDNLLQ